MKPKYVIFRHPGRLDQQARENLLQGVRHLFGEDVKAMLLLEGMECWIIGEDGLLYDLNNPSELVKCERAKGVVDFSLVVANVGDDGTLIGARTNT